ncbi:hypothetical protein LOD99_10952 [Oopsacas minuta]|uniref:Uncharacterized protein n=1 Tax=Oopsacas minuta TaxID=111878 RepID=A0AAV7KDE1_9METZ|nr:hypothetical protein LOD99_10952 [Oopsacas minuta]
MTTHRPARTSQRPAVSKAKPSQPTAGGAASTGVTTSESPRLTNVPPAKPSRRPLLATPTPSASVNRTSGSPINRPPRLSKFFDDLPNLSNLSIAEHESPDKPYKPTTSSTKVQPPSQHTANLSSTTYKSSPNVEITPKQPTARTNPKTITTNDEPTPSSTPPYNITSGEGSYLANLPHNCALYNILNSEEYFYLEDTQPNKLTFPQKLSISQAIDSLMHHILLNHSISGCLRQPPLNN